MLSLCIKKSSVISVNEYSTEGVCILAMLHQSKHILHASYSDAVSDIARYVTTQGPFH